MPEPFLFVGLDYENPYEAAEFAKELAQVKDDRFGFKINLDLFINCALNGDTEPLAIIDELGKPMFADFKMWNGRRTMTSIAQTAGVTGIDYFNVYSLAGGDFLEKVVEEANKKSTKVLGVTVLTHYDDDYCQRMRGCSMEKAVRKDAEVAYDAGCHGIILPGTMLGEVRDLEMEKLVPAVRPDWYGKTGDNYQKQEFSVREAIEGGANLLVCSSPIRKSKDRKEALVKTLEEMS